MITYPNVKVNLGLHVLRRRQDGFHDLETLFVPYFGLHDTLEIISGDDFSLTSASLFSRYGALGGGDGLETVAARGFVSGRDPRSGRDGAHSAEVFQAVSSSGGVQSSEPSYPRIVQAIREDGKLMITIARAEGVDWDPLKDLTAKAYALLDEDYTLPPVKIFLEKTSPVGAGLGGGSADAAFALRMISELFGLGLSDEILASYASRLGSDCAFFVYNRPMMGEGRGEILTPYDGLVYEKDGDNVMVGGKLLRVTVPSGIAVSTREAYGGIVPREKSGVSTSPLREILAMPVPQWPDVLVNDFEATVFAAHPQLAAIKEKLYADGAVYASMSGSGSALFGLY